MVAIISEGLNVFTVFKAEGSGGMLIREKLIFFRDSGRTFAHDRCCHHNTHIQTEIEKA